MKNILFIIPLVIFSCFFYLNEEVVKTNNNKIEVNPDIDHEKSTRISDYDINAELFPEKKLLKVSEEIIWRNTTGIPAKELYFHLYANAFANNKTEFSKKHHLEEDEKTKIEFSSFRVNGKEQALIYAQLEVDNPYDSTVARIDLDNEILPRDSVIIKIEYSLTIPKSVSRFGYAAGRDFYFLAQWFPKLGVFENGKWVCSPYYYNTEFYSDFSNYKIAVTVPPKYTVGSSGKLVSEENLDGSKKYLFKLNNAIDFAWFTSNEISEFAKTYKSNSGKDIQLCLYTQPENKGKEQRYWKAVENTIEYLEGKIGEFPYNTLTCVDVPRTSNIGGMEYPGLFTFFTPLFSPDKINSPEATIVHEIVHQYFYASVANNEVYEGWLDEGITSYLEEKILDKYYGRPAIYFRFIDYYPIYGINFLSLYEIPVIYSLQDMYSENYADNLYIYYRNSGRGTITDTTCLLPGTLSWIANTYSKPSLVFHSMDRYLGEDEFLSKLSNYYHENKFSHTDSEKFLKIFSNEEAGNLIDNFVLHNYRFDYRLVSITRIDSGKYELLVENLDNGKLPVDIRIYTEDDSSTIYWDGADDWKVITFESDKPVIAAEIDPDRKNLLDENYANNSYTMETKYWAAYSISIRWFFWVQNALLVLGSIG